MIEKRLLFYLQGKGLDTSRKPQLNEYVCDDVRYIFKEPNNLYHFYPEDKVDYESLDFVFNDGLLSESKFFKLLIKEWFYVLKPGGNLVLRFSESNFIRADDVKELFESLVADCGEILYFLQAENKYLTLIVQKLKSVLSGDDDINRWSFCIINPSGQNIDSLSESIKSQHIPFYEIISDTPNFLNNIPTSAAIKNKLLMLARFENVVIIDRRKADIVLSDNWFKEIKRYGNYFDALSSVLVSRSGQRLADWWTLGCYKQSLAQNLFQRSTLGLLDYQDWDDWVYFPDPVCVLKKSLYRKSLWDIYCVDGDENTLFSHQLTLKGALLRLPTGPVCIIDNPQTKFLAENFPQFEYNSLKLGKRRKKILRRTVWSIAEFMVKLRALALKKKYQSK